MKNTQISQIAKNYADALVKLGQDNLLPFDEIFENLKNIQEILTSSKDLQIVLVNPSISDEVKISIIYEVFKENINPKIKDFFKILIEKKRVTEFNNILDAYKTALDKINNLQQVEVISAVDLTDSQKSRIVDALKSKLNKNIEPLWFVDEEIIGGLVVKINDNVIDTSLKKKLENLSKNIKGTLWR